VREVSCPFVEATRVFLAPTPESEVWAGSGPRYGRTRKPWGEWVENMVNARGDDTMGHVVAPTRVILTTDHVTTAAAGPLVAALHAAGVTVERHTFLPVRGEEQHPWGVLLLAASGPPLPLARLIVPATAPAGVALALAAALGVGERPVLATLQLKADGVFVSIRSPDLIDITQALDGLPAQLARLDTHREERRLIYSEGTWRIDP